jgi:transcriptional regulator with XRE-family HTH domain
MKDTVKNSLEPIRVAIQTEFLDRCRKNPAYSLRAFAKYLEIDQSHLSKILRGHRPVTKEIAVNVGPKLGLRTSQLKKLFSSGAATIPGFLTRSEDEFEVLSEWHHFAILELVKTDGFDPNPQKIAHRLGLHVEEARSALDRLERLNLIRITGGKIKILSRDNTWSNLKKTSSARKKLQRSLLEKSISAIDHIPFELRENASLTVAINKSRLAEFKEKLKELRQQIANQFQANNEKNLDEVYQLTISFFPLTKINNDTGESQ